MWGLFDAYKGSIEDIETFYKKNIDRRLWKIEDETKDKESYSLKLSPKSKEVKTHVIITVLKSDDKLFNIITSELKMEN